MKQEDAITLIKKEYLNTKKDYMPFNTKHEGYAFIQESLDSLWDTIKFEGKEEELRMKASQVSAMALRFLIDLIGR